MKTKKKNVVMEMIQKTNFQFPAEWCKLFKGIYDTANFLVLNSRK